ncbi:hypothetical protein DPMN_016720 [Dreissena polymorpha]|uniref:Uncharacterized protein n=1 Tax=Dreissena polymorpha TaxID=45954 RepID=A0A9D4NF49_DREPO|nr:hypothetical protein DPMN_016720 [Dreissena polymorpha]
MVAGNIYDQCHAQIGLMPYVASIALEKPAHLCSLLRSYPVCYEVTLGFIVSYADRVAGIMLVAFGTRLIFA